MCLHLIIEGFVLDVGPSYLSRHGCVIGKLLNLARRQSSTLKIISFSQYNVQRRTIGWWKKFNKWQKISLVVSLFDNLLFGSSFIVKHGDIIHVSQKKYCSPIVAIPVRSLGLGFSWENCQLSRWEQDSRTDTRN